MFEQGETLIYFQIEDVWNRTKEVPLTLKPKREFGIGFNFEVENPGMIVFLILDEEGVKPCLLVIPI